mgnify:CR=1 FL=1
MFDALLTVMLIAGFWAAVIVVVGLLEMLITKCFNRWGE